MIKLNRKGMFAGNIYTFTHKNPKTGEVWSDDIPNGPKVPDGRWVDADKIKWVKED